MQSNSSRIARLSVSSAEYLGKFQAGLRAVHAGFWLGVLDTENLHRATEAFYGKDEQFLDSDHNTRGLADWEHEAINTHVEPGGRILVPAAGGGREILALAELGYTTVGYDPVPALVDVGNTLIEASGSSAVLLQSHGNAVPAGLEPTFDCVLFGWGGISHVVGKDQRGVVFAELRDLLIHGGIIIVSFLPRSEPSRQYELTYRVATVVRKLRRSRDIVELGDSIEGSFDHHFTFDEIAVELTAAGFTELDRVTSSYPYVVCKKQ